MKPTSGPFRIKKDRAKKVDKNIAEYWMKDQVPKVKAVPVENKRQFFSKKNIEDYFCTIHPFLYHSQGVGPLWLAPNRALPSAKKEST